jgi:sugar lactone lactonase YvrE
MSYKTYYYISLVFFLIQFTSCSKTAGPEIPPDAHDIVITAIKPTHGPFNTIDTIIGKGFEKIPVVDSILLNGKKLSIISKSNEQIIVKIPELAGSGTIDVWHAGKLLRGPMFKYDSTLFVTTLAGSSVPGTLDGKGLDARFNGPEGIAADHLGNVYVADVYNRAIRKITPSGEVTTLAGNLGSSVSEHVDGTGANARFTLIKGLAIDGNGNLYVGEGFWVRKVSPAGVVTTITGRVPNTNIGGLQQADIDGDVSVATFLDVFGVTLDAQNHLYVADANNNKIKKIIPGGMVSTYAGKGYYQAGIKDGPLSTALLFAPFALSIDPKGNIYFIDGATTRLRKISHDGMVSTLFGPTAPTITGDSQFSAKALATDKEGNLYFSISVGIYKLSPDGKVSRYAAAGIGDEDGPVSVARFRSVNGIAVDASGTLYVVDRNRIRKIAWR